MQAQVQTKRRVLIMGAAGRDFHNFLMRFKDDVTSDVVAFTANQIPGVASRSLPAILFGYQHDIPIYDEVRLPEIVRSLCVDECVLAYSDLSNMEVADIMHRVLESGATFSVMAPRQTMIEATKPVVAIVASRTGCGKSQIARCVVQICREAGKRVAVLRHPMPYGVLIAQNIQRFERLEDLNTHECTIEEREEYEPHLREGTVVFAGIDYRAILKQAEAEADVIVWDGGNNDTPFIKPTVTITVVDPHRSGHEKTYYPGRENVTMADLVIIGKADSAKRAWLRQTHANVAQLNNRARRIEAHSNIVVPAEALPLFRRKKLLIVEDGPTVTHGGMAYGAGYIAARAHGARARRIISPRQYAVGSIKHVFKEYPHAKLVLPAMGYGQEQLADLEATINKVPCDAVVIASPARIEERITIRKPYFRVSYSYTEETKGQITEYLKNWAKVL